LRTVCNPKNDIDYQGERITIKLELPFGDNFIVVILSLPKPSLAFTRLIMCLALEGQGINLVSFARLGIGIVMLEESLVAQGRPRETGFFQHSIGVLLIVSLLWP